jgi:transposase
MELYLAKGGVRGKNISMTLHEQAASMSRNEIVTLLLDQKKSSEQINTLTTHVDELRQQLDWFKRQLFGTKSDRRILPENIHQLTLGESLRRHDDSVSVPATTVREHSRKIRKSPSADESRLRFDSSVPIEVIEVPNTEVRGNEDNYYFVDNKITDRLAQRPGSYVVLRYVRKVYKKKKSGEFSCPPAPVSVLEKSFADVSFLAGLLIEKYRYHLPYYRQHQRLAAAGVNIGRSTLTYLAQRVAELLDPICTSQFNSILSSGVLAMDETPIRAGRKSKGKMKTGYFWPIYGDRDEIVFPFSPSRSGDLVEEVLKDYHGVLLTDGYKVYERYAEKVNGIVHAQCWSHTRRHFVEAEAAEPELSGHILDRIALLYEFENEIRERKFADERKQLYRAEHCKPVVDEIFFKLEEAMREHILLPSSPFTKAANYASDREKPLRVFLEYPNVPVDTNHLEREIRPIALGRKNWLFAWTELGAHDTGVIQSLLATCRLQGVDPYVYLVDVLQRVSSHPARDVAQLTPRLWKEHFADDPMRSDLDRIRNHDRGG